VRAGKLVQVVPIDRYPKYRAHTPATSDKCCPHQIKAGVRGVMIRVLLCVERRQRQRGTTASLSNLYKQFRKRSSTLRNTSKFREPVVMSMLLKSQSVLGVSRVSRQHARVAVRAVAPASPAMDRLMGATRLSVLDHADEELQNLCSTKGTPEEQAQCWEVRCGCLVMHFLCMLSLRSLFWEPRSHKLRKYRLIGVSVSD